MLASDVTRWTRTVRARPQDAPSGPCHTTQTRIASSPELRASPPRAGRDVYTRTETSGSARGRSPNTLSLPDGARSSNPLSTRKDTREAALMGK